MSEVAFILLLINFFVLLLLYIIILLNYFFILPYTLFPASCGNAVAYIHMMVYIYTCIYSVVVFIIYTSFYNFFVHKQLIIIIFPSFPSCSVDDDDEI